MADIRNPRITNKMLTEYIPAAEAERVYGLTPGIIRQWIRRGINLNHGEYFKMAQWYVDIKAIERIVSETDWE